MSAGATSPKRFAVVCVGKGSVTGRMRSPFGLVEAWYSTMNGSGASSTKRRSPRAIRRSVFSASGRSRSKMEGHGIDQSMHSAAVR